MLTNYIDDLVATQHVPDDVIRLVEELPSKRLGILAFINDNRLLFTDILKIINDNDVSDLNHLPLLFDKLSEYAPIPLTTRKKHGDTRTSLALVETVLDKLPSSLWSNPNLKWFDPANGIGSFPLIIITRLMDSLKEWQPNASIRYKHIIENMIYVSEIQPINLFLFQCIVNPFGKYSLNLFMGSSTSIEFDNHVRDIWGVDKFDVISGMPPYNYTTYLPFINKFITHCDHMAFIVPSKITLNLNEVRYLQLLKNNGLSYLKFLGYNKYDVYLSTLYFILNKNKNTPYIIINDVVEIEQEDPIHNYDNHIEYSIMSKISDLHKMKIYRGKNETLSYGSVVGSSTVKFSPDVNHSVKMLTRLGGGKKIEYHYIESDKDLRGDKMVMPRASGNFNSMKNHRNLSRDFIYNTFMPSDVAVSRSIMYLFVEDVNEYENTSWYIGRSKWLRYVFIKYNTFEELSKKMFEQYIPMIPLAKKMNDADLYKYFNFNNTEIKYIESVVGEYKK